MSNELEALCHEQDAMSSEQMIISIFRIQNLLIETDEVIQEL